MQVVRFAKNFYSKTDIKHCVKTAVVKTICLSVIGFKLKVL